MIAQLPTRAPEVLLGPGIGLDCAVVEMQGELIVLKTDPITFASDQLGWYTVQVCVNDLVTTGATPRWLMVTLLLPQTGATDWLEQITEQLGQACRDVGLTLVGGHTEITVGLERPIAVGMLVGEVTRDRLVTPRGTRSGDRLLLTKGVPVEATALLSRELRKRLCGEYPLLTQAELEEAQNFLFDPGISVLREAKAAVDAGGVHAMHDPTEGGLYTALWEMAEACGRSLRVDLERVPVLPPGRRICGLLGLDPLGAIASGALLMAVDPQKVKTVQAAVQNLGIACVEIGQFTDDDADPVVWAGFSAGAKRLPRPERDEIARLFETL